MASRRSPAVSGRRRSSKKGPPTPALRDLAQELPPGTEVEVRIDDEGFYGSWYEATVDGFDPGTTGARGRGSSARYTVTYARLVSEDGPERVAVSHVRPRPPPPPRPPAPAPGFLLHDIVEVFVCDGWWSGIVVDPVPDDPGAPVIVAFPITREVAAFSRRRHLIRRRRDFVGGEWVPSQAVVAIQPKRGARVYKAGEKVEVLREREAYGDSWFPAVVSKAVDRLSYIVEYLDDGQEGGGRMAKEYLHWGYIRPAQYHRPRESKVHLGPGAAVEVHCDGAWSQGTVCRVVGMGCSYEVNVKGVGSEQLVTKAGEEIRLLYMWNGRHWTIPIDKERQANSRQQSASKKNTSTPVDATSSDGEHCCDPDPESSSSTAKKSRREQQMQELILEEGFEHASVFATDCSLPSLHKSLASDRCPNSGLPPSEKNGQLNAPVSVCGRNADEASDDEHTCAPESSRAKRSRREPLLQELILEEGLEHASVFEIDAGSLSTLHTFLASDPCPNSCFLLSEKNGQLNAPVSACGKNADEACNMLSISEVREQNITSSLRNQQAQERPLFVKALSVKKGVSKNKRGGTHPNAHQGENNSSYTVQAQLKEKSSNETFSSLSASTECQTAPAQTQQVSGGVIGGSDTECVNFEILARDEGAGLLDKELAATINRICQGNRIADMGTSTATTQNDDSSPFTIGNIQLRSCAFSGSSMPSRPSPSQVCGDHVPFVKRSSVWGIIDVMDVFKKLPQQPHFSPLMEYPPGLREGMALGLMVTFADSVVEISNSSIADPIESFDNKISTLNHLEKNGFDVQFLRYSLTKLQQVKSNHTIRLTEKEELNAQVLEKATSLSQIVEQLDKKEQNVARLEGELERALSEVQKMAEEKESENKELSKLEAARSSVDEACGDAELQFQRILAEVCRKSLT